MVAVTVNCVCVCEATENSLKVANVTICIIHIRSYHWCGVQQWLEFGENVLNEVAAVLNSETAPLTVAMVELHSQLCVMWLGVCV